MSVWGKDYRKNAESEKSVRIALFHILKRNSCCHSIYMQMKSTLCHVKKISAATRGCNSLFLLYNGANVSKGDYEKELDAVYDSVKAKNGYTSENLYSAQEMINYIEDIL